MEGIMKNFMLPFFLICCAVPIRAGAADFFNSAGSFKIAKAVKLGRGSAYNSTALQQISGSQFKTSRTVTACPGGEDCGCKETNIDLKKNSGEKFSAVFFNRGIWR